MGPTTDSHNTTGDTLSRVLAACRSERAATARFSLTAPWALRSEGVEGLLIRLGAGAPCWLQVDGLAPQPLGEGDIALLPSGVAHIVASDPALSPQPIQPLIAAHMRGRHGEHPLCFAHGGGGAATELYSLHLWVPAAVLAPVLRRLPPLLLLRQAESPTHALLALSMRALVDDTLRQRPGWQLSANRMADLLLVHVLREWLGQAQDPHAAWWRGLDDMRIARAVALMQEEPARPWTVDALARACGLSRTVFTERFRALMGQSPMDHLVAQRMALAARLLRERRRDLWSVAEAVGYGSDKAFARAFQRHMGATPAAWLRGAD